MRRYNRIITVQFLYMWDINNNSSLHCMINNFFYIENKNKSFYFFSEELIFGTLKNLSCIDQAIQYYVINWNFNRIAKIELAVLRLATHELLHRPDIPPVVSINEALEIIKIFSHSRAYRFVNGVLDQIKNQLKRPLRI